MLHGQRPRADTTTAWEMRRNAGHQQGQTWETNEWKMLHGLGDKRIEMLHGQQKRPGRQMNRNATWPADKGGQQQ